MAGLKGQHTCWTLYTLRDDFLGVSLTDKGPNDRKSLNPAVDSQTVASIVGRSSTKVVEFGKSSKVIETDGMGKVGKIL